MHDIGLNTEEKLLISLCRLEFSEEKKGETYSFIKEVTDWEYFVEAANKHGIIALAHDNIHRLGFSELVPEKQRNQMHSGFLKSIARNALIRRIAEELIQIAKTENIRVVLLKGLALERTIYGDKGLRQMTDLDILVAREDAMKLRKAMQKNGFEAAPFISRIYERNLFVEGKHLPEMTKYGIDTEIHFRLFDEQEIHFTEELYSTAIPQNTGSNPFFPSPLLHFLYLIKHLYRHEKEGSSQLRLYTDLFLLVESEKENILNEKLFGLADQTGLTEFLHEKLSILDHFWGSDFYPDEILPNAILIFTGFLKNPEQNFTEGSQNPLIPLKNIKGLTNKLLFIIGFIFPSGEFLRYKYRRENKPMAILYMKWWRRLFAKLKGIPGSLKKYDFPDSSN